MGLVDTLEPIKCCTRNKDEYDVYDILKNIKIDCNDRKKSITIFSETYLNDEITNGWKDLNQWLSANLDIGDHKVKISFEYESEDNGQLAA